MRAAARPRRAAPAGRRAQDRRSDEAERIATESQDPSDRGARAARRGRRGHGGSASTRRRRKALDMAIARAPAEQQTALRLEQARLLLRGGRRERALEVLGRVVATGPEADAAEALWLRARALEDADRMPEAVTAYKALAARYPRREVAGGAMWRLGWLAYLKGDLRDAAKSGRSWSRARQSRRTAIGAIYWRARAIEQTRRSGGGDAALPAGARRGAAQLLRRAGAPVGCGGHDRRVHPGSGHAADRSARGARRRSRDSRGSSCSAAWG